MAFSGYLYFSIENRYIMAKSPTEFSKMYHTFWSGKTGKALRGDGEAQAIQHYLIDNAQSNMWGLYYLPKVYITYDTGHRLKTINRVFKKLSDLNFSYYDEETEYIFVVEMCHIQVGTLKRATEEKKADLRISSANKFYEAVPNNPFIEAFYKRYKEELCLSSISRPLEGAYKGLTRDITFSVDVDADDNKISLESSFKEKDRWYFYFSAVCWANRLSRTTCLFL